MLCITVGLGAVVRGVITLLNGCECIPSQTILMTKVLLFCHCDANSYGPVGFTQWFINPTQLFQEKENLLLLS